MPLSQFELVHFQTGGLNRLQSPSGRNGRDARCPSETGRMPVFPVEPPRRRLSMRVQQLRPSHRRVCPPRKYATGETPVVPVKRAGCPFSQLRRRDSGSPCGCNSCAPPTEGSVPPQIRNGRDARCPSETGKMPVFPVAPPRRRLNMRSRRSATLQLSRSQVRKQACFLTQNATRRSCARRAASGQPSS